MNFKTVIFDLDGTIIDSFPGISECAEYTLNTLGASFKQGVGMKQFVGPPLMYSFTNLCGMSEERARLAVKVYREHYVAGGMYNNTLYGGIVPLLAGLKERGVTLAVATSKVEEFARKILARHNIDGMFAFIGGAASDDSRTSKKAVLEYVLENLGGAKGALMVGDRQYDILGAHACGLPAAGALWGYGSRQELAAAGAEYFAERPEDILSLL